ncbi:MULTISPECIES: hypothetical protein [unclassified Bradyrhizobium]|uniref:hypothetical protein n=1 Tax=unclassified Bradyrhizobium TaxID=2631580 RepID=UPI002479C1AA|nr:MULTISPECIES: hypothetical protein [unclassified Bradyrhizobium]WGS23009.1 hypothetical protein MTX22_16020 [Bradyrhizobium sp. ISRA463]WGS30008.1 hypothetical protein MTX19_13745 [Bradyrhizobium sp. ISRA464]
MSAPRITIFERIIGQGPLKPNEEKAWRRNPPAKPLFFATAGLQSSGSAAARASAFNQKGFCPERQCQFGL